jgi:hypothetical protein
MYFLKYLVAFVLAFSGMAVEPVDGWFPVEKVATRGADQAEEDDSSIWVLFSKQVGDEKFLARFPSDPVYRYVGSDVLQISSEKDGERFEVTVQPRDSSGQEGDFSYEVEGKWVQEHLVQTGSHFYRFKTVCKQANSPSREAFISSFSIEENG